MSAEVAGQTGSGDGPKPAADPSVWRRRLVRIELVLGALAIIALIFVVLVGVLGIGDFASRSVGT